MLEVLKEQQKSVRANQESGGLQACTLYVITHRPPCSSCECHHHTNYFRQSKLLMGTRHVVFHALFNLHNHQQVTTDDAAHYV